MSSPNEEKFFLYNEIKIPLKSFNEFIIIEGEPHVYNSQLEMAIPIDINDEKLISEFELNECNIRMLRGQLSRLQDEPMVPEEYNDKYCAIFGGKIFHSFDTKEELDAFRNNEGKKGGLLYSFYYPK